MTTSGTHRPVAGPLNVTVDQDARAKLTRPDGTAERSDWYRVENAGAETAEVSIYGEIGWEVTADEFIAELKAITAPRIDLHLSTPGGNVFEAVAIYNALLDHPAYVTVMVDALAASAGSFIAQGGDKVVMGRGAQMMIHEARGLVVGTADDMREIAGLLDRHNDGIASIYAQRAENGAVADWRKRMKDESWFSAEEAVDVGLADEIVPTEPRKAKQGGEPEASFDLSSFRYAGRDHAPAPDLGNRASSPGASPANQAAAIEGGDEPLEEKTSNQDTEPANDHSGLNIPQVRMALLRHTAAL